MLSSSLRLIHVRLHHCPMNGQKRRDEQNRHTSSRHSMFAARICPGRINKRQEPTFAQTQWRKAASYHLSRRPQLRINC